MEFRHGYLEQLEKLGLPDNSFDNIVSNCVLDLCTDKTVVLKETHRLLKPGGESYFSDMYADHHLPPAIQQDPVLYGECLAGALYWNDFTKFARTCGFTDPRLVEDHLINIGNNIIAARVASSTAHPAAKINGKLCAT